MMGNQFKSDYKFRDLRPDYSLVQGAGGSLWYTIDRHEKRIMGLNIKSAPISFEHALDAHTILTVTRDKMIYIVPGGLTTNMN